MKDKKLILDLLPLIKEWINLTPHICIKPPQKNCRCCYLNDLLIRMEKEINYDN